MLITQALAEIKLTGNKTTKATQEAREYSYRRGDQVDPLARQGGSSEFVQARLQSIFDQFENLIVLRRRIRQRNETTNLTINGQTRSIADWLVWRREVAEPSINAISAILIGIAQARKQAPPRTTTDAPEPIISHINEKGLMEKVSEWKNIVGLLDGELSVLNATTEI